MLIENYIKFNAETEAKYRDERKTTKSSKRFKQCLHIINYNTYLTDPTTINKNYILF